MGRIETIGTATLYLGDCREILPQLEGYDAVVTDPPYGVGKDYGPLVKDTLELFQSAVQLVQDTGRPGAVFVPVSRLYDLPVRPQWTCVWTKRYGASGLLAYPIYPHWEAIALFNLKGDYKGNKGHRSDVFHFSPTRPDDNSHPTPKPVDLMYELLDFMPGNVICDPFLGSGTTGMAAAKMRRPFIGIELEERWFDLACRRIQDTVNRPDMFATETV